MKRIPHLGACAVAIGTLIVSSCSRKSEDQTQQEPSQVFDINRPPVEAPQSVKLSDFRLNPPKVLDVTFKKIDAQKQLAAVQFAPDKRLERTLTINPDEGPIVLHDDGSNGDEKAGDNIFSAIIESDWDARAAEQDRTLEFMSRKETMSVPVFEGREIVREQKVDLTELRRLRDLGILKHLPFGSGGSAVVPGASLLITDLNVVGDPTRTFDPCTGTGNGMGKWSFGYLMTAMANQSQTGVDPAVFVLNWLQTWLTAQPVNGFSVPSRAAIQNLINNWPKINGKLDLARAPMKLSAIVNRIDLATNMSYGRGGGAEGRFVFTVASGTSANCSIQPFTVIFEYGVPIHTCPKLKSWAQQWLNLQNLPLGSAQYNAALEAITEQFAAANADPAKPNGSALNQLRTNEIALASPWELREFQVAASHQLRTVTVKQTPEKSDTTQAALPPLFFQSGPKNSLLVNWINGNSAAIAANKYTVPNALPGNVPFLGGSSPNNIDFWNATSQTGQIVTEQVRHQFSLNTCNACHGAETQDSFRHIVQNASGPATLSGFLTGITVTVPVQPSTQTIPPNSPNPQYSFNDLARRAQVLSQIASNNCFIGPLPLPVLLATD
jgi:hypothetical protein